MTIRGATDADLPAIINIYNAAIMSRVATAQLEPITAGEGSNLLKAHSADRFPLWVLEIGGHIAGWLSFKPFLPRCAYRGTAELSVYVDEKFRRRGVAKRLLERALAHSPELGIETLVGLIFAHNEPSLRLFEQLGFVRWGFLPQVARIGDALHDLIILGRQCAVERCSQTQLTPRR
jgi:L-amino acid N-acyltransferase YncA